MRLRASITTQSTRGLSAAFARLDLRPELERALVDCGFEEPRPIQARALPHALDGRDVLGLAQTGTGKTAAFALPILQRLLEKPGRGPRALVLAPTRELAAQVQAEFERLAAHTKLTSIAIFGGVPIARHVRAVRSRPDVIVACPGRLLDLLQRGDLRLDRVEVCVLDEADHMFDMGFLPDVRRILSALPKRRQNLLFSATMPREIRGLAERELRNPARVELANSSPAETIEHVICPLAEREKVGALERLVRGDDFRSAIVFVRTKRRARQLARKLDERGHSAVALQGNMSQGQRERALAGFRAGRHDLLVATDVAARGLDIEGVSHVVNFDVPTTPEAYTHRVGRTGRAERSGRAYTFVKPDDAPAVRAIEKKIGKRIDRLELAGKGGGGGGSDRKRRTSTEPSRPRSGQGPGKGPARRRGDRRRTTETSEAKRPAAKSGRRRKPAARQEKVAVAVAPAPVSNEPAFGHGVHAEAESKPRRRRWRRS